MTKLVRVYISTATFMVLAGCSSKPKRFDLMESADYQNRPQLHQSLMNGSQPMTEAVVQKMSTSRVAFPKVINLAIVRISDSNGELDFQTIDDGVVDKFYDEANWGPRVRSITPVPQILISKPVTLTSLRQVAVLLQADALLIVKPVSYGDWKFQLFENNKAKGVTSLEVLLLDTRTSVVPFTQIITETAEVEKDKEHDYSDFELMARAKKLSESKALMQVAPAVKKFISKAL